MNAPELQSKHELANLEEEGRLAVLQRFDIKDIQHLSSDDLLAVQSLLGHGDLWGCWQTPKSLAPSKIPRILRNIDFVRRIHVYLAKEEIIGTSIDQLVEESVLELTRIALLMRLTPFRRRNTKGALLKPSSISTYLFQAWPLITARAIRRKVDDPTSFGLFQCLTDEDMQEFCANKNTRAELDRLDTFVARRVWSDAPRLPDVRQITNPSQKTAARPPQDNPNQYLPFPEDWLANIGPRVLWIVQDLGPNLLVLLEAMPQEMKSINWELGTARIYKKLAICIAEHLNHHSWLDRAGNPLSPAFRLTTSSGKLGSDQFEWPPRGWEHIIKLSVTLQAAHLFITLLSSAGRIGEVSTLTRGCVEIGRDVKNYLKGFTYKLSDNLFGDVRQWPAPEILCQCMGQQARFAAAMDWLPDSIKLGLPISPRFGNTLWVSIGINGNTGESAEINFNQTLITLANRLDVNPKPGGVNIHPHRFRKTIGRLAGIALFNAPLVLKRLFGHKSIEMTLHYILCDHGVREEAEKVLRELRIMHCADALEEIHQALRDNLPLPGNGGPGAARLVTTVRNADDQLKQFGRVWDDGSAYDLAYLLTAQGKGWRLIKENIVCSKAPGEDGLCQKTRSKGEPNTANCQPECDNRIVLMRQRRDSEQIIEQYLDIARQARDDGQLLVLSSVVSNVREELENFTDLKAKYLSNHEVLSLFTLCDETEAESES
ncbi:MAG: hypothetical protein LUQ11_10240 [Methylococcaceae bacterium]|nr:hypothetical protein [Methylococcaceae bacterium]